MTTNSKQDTNNQEEINILYLFERLGEFLEKLFRSFINLIGSILIYLIRKWYYLVIALVLSVISALILSNISPSYYYSDLIMRSNATHNQQIMSSLNKLKGYADTQNHNGLSNELDISLEDASVLKELETYWYYDIGADGIYDGIDTEMLYISDTNVVKVDNEFVIRVAIYDPNLIGELERGIVYFLESNPFLEALNEQRLSNLEAQMIQTQYEIEKLDSLQKREYYTNSENLRQSEGQIVFTSEKVAQTYHNDMFRLLQTKQEYERDLNIYNDVVTIIESFSTPIEPDNGAMHYLGKLIWFYLGLALVLSVMITFRKKIWNNED